MQVGLYLYFISCLEKKVRYSRDLVFEEESSKTTSKFARKNSKKEKKKHLRHPSTLIF